MIPVLQSCKCIQTRFSRLMSTSAFLRPSELKLGLDLDILTYPGSRIIEADCSNYNFLMLSDLIDKTLKSYEHNDVIHAILFQSYHRSKLSLNPKDNNMESTHKIIGSIKSLKKPSITVFSEKLNGTYFGVLSSVKYKLGTESSRLCIDELFYDRLPVGGIAFHLARNSIAGVEFARYLGLSGVDVNLLELLSLGLISRVVGPNGAATFASYFAETASANHTASHLCNIVAGDSLEETLNLVNYEFDEDEEADILKDELWVLNFHHLIILYCAGKVMLVPPQDYFTTKEFFGDNSVEENLELIQHHFSNDDATKCLELLRQNASKYECLDRINQAVHRLRPDVIQEWFDLTRLARSSDLNSVLNAEQDATTRIINK